MGKMPSLLVANSPTKDPTLRNVSTGNVRDLARRLKISFVEVSSADGTGVSDCFNSIAELINNKVTRIPSITTNKPAAYYPAKSTTQVENIAGNPTLYDREVFQDIFADRGR
eukprot:gb/GEZN01019467.1/.p1 GENE.gb/GEZN01019467.1/~~gb/GEZN01019467.1/.p1  ORF type:complete len:119 (-),score=15.78 gb/GEZN01019467.1/:362-697(-)